MNKKITIFSLITLSVMISILIYAKEPMLGKRATIEKQKWTAFTDNLIDIKYNHVGITSSVQETGIWQPTEEEFEDIYRYVYGNAMVNWQSIDGTERCVDKFGNRSNCIKHWEAEYNRAKERGLLQADVLGGLRKGVRNNIKNSDVYNKELQPVVKKKSLFGWLKNWIKIAIAGVEFSDQFTEGSLTALKDHTPDTTGTGWTDLIDVGTCDLYIYNIFNRLQASSSANCWGVSGDGNLCSTDDTMSGADYQVDVLQTNGDSIDDTSQICCRIQDANNMYCLLWNEADADLYKNTAGSWATIDTTEAGIADGSTVSLKCIGTTISVEDDSVEIMTAEDATHSSAGEAGVGMGAVILVDDDVSDQQLDDFVVTVSAAAPPTGAEASVQIKQGTLYIKQGELQIKQ